MYHRPITRHLGLTRFAGLLLFIGGCAGLARTEGTTGPIVWHATDFGTVTRNIQGQSVDTYDFTLAIKNVSDRTLTLTKMHRTVYQAGSGQPGYSAVDGRWELRPGAEWKFPLYSYSYCNAAQGCVDRGGAQPMWKIVFTGIDDQQRSIEARLDITLPPRTAAKHIDLAVTRTTPPAGPPPGSGMAAAPRSSLPATSPSPPIQQQANASATTKVVTAVVTTTANLKADVPTWRPGYEWEYRWESPRGKGTFVWSVSRIEVVEGTEYYVVAASEGREI